MRSHLAELNMLSDTLFRMREALRKHIFYLQDATVRQSALETQLRKAQKLEAVGLLAGGIAHDFNNLLQVAGGNADLALAADSQNDDREKAPASILSAVEQASQLTRQLLAFGRRQALHRECAEINSLVAGHMAMIRRLIPENTRLDLLSAAHPIMSMADKGQMEQVLINLCLNAGDAMPDGGVLYVAIEPVVLDAATADQFCQRPAGPFVRLTISDTGHGVSAAALERIFEPFFTTKSRDNGSGLGLALVYGIIHQHGGHIAARSEPVRGTEFVVLLSSEDGAVAPSSDSTPVPLAQDQGPAEMTILLAEDNGAVREAAERMLTRLGTRAHRT